MDRFESAGGSSRGQRRARRGRWDSLRKIRQWRRPGYTGAAWDERRDGLDPFHRSESPFRAPGITADRPGHTARAQPSGRRSEALVATRLRPVSPVLGSLHAAGLASLDGPHSMGPTRWAPWRSLPGAAGSRCSTITLSTPAKAVAGNQPIDDAARSAASAVRCSGASSARTSTAGRSQPTATGSRPSRGKIT